VINYRNLEGLGRLQ